MKHSIVKWKKRNSKEDKDYVEAPKLIGKLTPVKFIEDDEFNAKAMGAMKVTW